MDDLKMILQKRSLPGIMVFDSNDELLYLCKKAENILKTYRKEIDFHQEFCIIPKEINNLCESFKKGNKDPSNPISSFYCNDKLYTIRAIPLYKAEKKREPFHVMVMIETCTQGRSFNLNSKEIIKRFGLTKRECEVIFEILKGFSNKDIASNLLISEYTAKDHIKHIMRKLKVKNRASILSKLFK